MEVIIKWQLFVLDLSEPLPGSSQAQAEGVLGLRWAGTIPLLLSSSWLSLTVQNLSSFGFLLPFERKKYILYESPLGKMEKVQSEREIESETVCMSTCICGEHTLL